MKTKMLLLIVFVCMYCGFMSAQTLPATDSVFIVMKDGTVHKFDKAKDMTTYDVISTSQKDAIKQFYQKDEMEDIKTSPPDSVFIVMNDGTVHKLDEAKKEDKAIYDSIIGDQDIKYLYKKDEIGIYYSFCDQRPEFKGGTTALLSYLNKNLKYPEEAAKSGIEGQENVYVQFIIDETGTVGHAKILRGNSRLLRDEALRVVGLLPKWNPGIVGGKAVRTTYVVPIQFRFAIGVCCTVFVE